jgi:IS30 family transposase
MAFPFECQQSVITQKSQVRIALTCGGWSPEQIAGQLQLDGQSFRVSHEPIYAYVYGPDGQSEDLARHLPHRRKKRQPRRRRTLRGLVFPPDRSIDERPDHVKTRETFGEWDGD